MKRFLPLLLFIVLFLYCPKKYKPALEKIEIYNIGLIYNDILKEKPLLAGLNDLPGISIGSCHTEPDFLQVIMGRIGLADLLSNTGIDYVIGNVDALHFENVSYFVVPDYMGYGIQNIGGIRFAVFYPGKKDLSISDQVEIAMVKQRSDIFWLITEDEARSALRKIDFYIQDRSIADTSWSVFSTEPDSLIAAKIKAFRQKLTQTLNYRIYIGGQPLSSYMLARMIADEPEAIVLYPAGIFGDSNKYDSLTVFDFIKKVDCRMRFKTHANLTGNKVDSIISVNNYNSFGKIKKANNKVMMPDNEGRYLFDIIAPR